MNPTDPAFPPVIVFAGGATSATAEAHGNCGGMDLRTYMATQFVAASIANAGASASAATQVGIADTAVAQADALIARLNTK